MSLPIGYARYDLEGQWEVFCPVCWVGGDADAEIDDLNGDTLTCKDCGGLIGRPKDPAELLTITIPRVVLATALATMNGWAYLVSKMGNLELELHTRAARDQLRDATKGML